MPTARLADRIKRGGQPRPGEQEKDGPRRESLYAAPALPARGPSLRRPAALRPRLPSRALLALRQSRFLGVASSQR